MLVRGPGIARIRDVHVRARHDVSRCDDATVHCNDSVCAASIVRLPWKMTMVAAGVESTAARVVSWS
jgi:hypothetical protein